MLLLIEKYTRNKLDGNAYSPALGHKDTVTEYISINILPL